MESAALSTSGLVAVFLAVWGATDMVRSGQNVFSAMFISTGKEKGQGCATSSRNEARSVGQHFAFLLSAIDRLVSCESSVDSEYAIGCASLGFAGSGPSNV
jgi:hypothetical protein